MKCGAFNAGITIHPDGKISPCCLTDFRYRKDPNEIKDWTDPWKDLRSGIACDACKKPGDTYKRAFDNYVDPTKDFSIKFLDVRNNNLCNLECVNCNTYYSSKWAKRLGKENPYQSREFDYDISHVERIYFAGGEPLMNKTHWEVLDSIQKPNNVDLVYSTNMTLVTSMKEKLAKYWPKFRSIFINASMDGIGKLNDALRPGSKFEVIEKNFTFVQQNFTNCKIVVNPTVNAINIFYLRDIENWADSYNTRTRYNMLYHPKSLCVSSLLPQFKELIPYIPENEQLKQLLDQDTSEHFDDMISQILLSDRLRKVDAWSFLPDPIKQYAIKRWFNE